MKNVYHIGRFQFDSYTEYKKGLEDVKKIKYISDEVDINEPGVALRLYTLIRQNEINFQSAIGEDYLLYLSDLLADDYKELSDVETPYLANLGRTRSPRKLVGILCIVAAVICFLYFVGSEWVSYQRTRELRELQQDRDTSRAAGYIADRLKEKYQERAEEDVPQEEHASQGEAVTGEVGQVGPETVEVPKTILPEYADLHEQNPDMVGWITIAETTVDYPVLQSPDSNEYYLKHNFLGEEDANGCIFLDMRNHLEPGDTNLILYGHNMRSGMMFGELKKYQEEEHFKAHPQIEFHTLYEKRKYDIIAVCLAQVEYQDEERFRYYNFLNAASQQEFDVFKENVEKLNIYGDSVDMEYGDQLLTLSTCNNYIEDGRLFLVARRVE